MRFRTLLLLGLVALWGYCVSQAFSASNEPSPEDATKKDTAFAWSSDFLGSSIWDDGKTEISLYRAEIQWNYGARTHQQNLSINSFLVKHSIDLETFGKEASSDGLEVFQGNFVYRVGLATRSRLFTASRQALKFLRHSFTEISTEGSCLLELARVAERFKGLHRCATQRMPDWSGRTVRGGLSILQVPLAIRALDLGPTNPTTTLKILTARGEVLEVSANWQGWDKTATGNGRTVEKIVLTYPQGLRNPGGLLSLVAPKETYWRTVEKEPQIVKILGEGSPLAHYKIELADTFRVTEVNQEVVTRIHDFSGWP